jgi:UDP-N-acetylmuramate: L-alanyl-gamma-D-glutamyl-meso-diaminopimelate ligase
MGSEAFQRAAGEVPKRVHFIGVCGTGMGALALLFREMGAEVSGSDVQAYPPMGDLLRGAGIDIRLGYRPENVAGNLDYVVVGNAVSKNNPEVEEVLRRGLAYGSFPETLARFFLAMREPVVVVGTHGKTTSTALLAWVLEAAGHAPGFLVGGEPKNFPSSSRFGTGPYFVVEGDEYDSAFFDKGPKFLHYRPRFSLFTSLEYDHADIYPDVDSLRTQFRRFVQGITPEGLLLVCSQYPTAVEIAREASCTVETYGYGQESDWRGVLRQNDPDGLTIEVSFLRSFVGSFSSHLSGGHNGLNILGCIALLSRLGVQIEQIRRGLYGFLGVRRRQEILGEVDGVLLVDDFAHHPTAVRETIRSMARRFPGRRILAIYEPRTHTSRKSVFQKEYVEAFQEANLAVCARIFRAETVPEEDRFRPDLWEKQMRERGKEAYYLQEMGDLERFLVQSARPGDLVLFMSSGDFEGVPGRVLRELGHRGQ